MNLANYEIDNGIFTPKTNIKIIRQNNKLLTIDTKTNSIISIVDTDTITKINIDHPPQTTDFINNSQNNILQFRRNRIKQNKLKLDKLKQAKQTNIQPCNILGNNNELNNQFNPRQYTLIAANTILGLSDVNNGLIDNSSFAAFNPSSINVELIARNCPSKELLKEFENYRSNYDVNSTIRLSTNETILKYGEKLGVFKKIKDGLYLSKITIKDTPLKQGYYYEPDYFHTGKSVHIEVYNKKGVHVGEMAIDGKTWKNPKADPNKKITI